MPETKAKKPTRRSRTGTPPAFQAPDGMPDVLPKDGERLKYFWQTGLLVSELHDFHFIETPIMENAELFTRVNDDAEEVGKRLMVYKHRKLGPIALRTEASAPIMRSYIENHLGYYASPLKVFFWGPVFPGGETAMTRQWGFKIIGDSDPIYDAEMITATLNFLNMLKIKQPLVKLNSAGCRVCRGNYREKLKTFCESKKDSLCVDCVKNYEKAPLTFMECTREQCRAIRKEAPIIFDFLCQNCNNHLKSVLEIVEDNQIAYEPDPYLMRASDRNNRTLFEIYTPSLPVPIAEGGRCDYLSELIGGRMIPTMGACISFERIMDAWNASETVLPLKTKPRIFFAAVGEQARKGSVRLMKMLRDAGIAVVEAVGKKSLKAQLKAAEKAHAPFALMYGQKEVFEKSVIFRDMRSGAQETITIERLVETVKQKIKSA